MIQLYTDGCCLINPNGPGGIGVAILENDNYITHISKGYKSTTNNRMELRAIIEALKYLKENNKTSEQIEVFTDSKMSVSCITGEWQKHSNLDLWQQYDELAQLFSNLSISWVKGHNGNKWNEYCGSIAGQAANDINLIEDTGFGGI